MQDDSNARRQRSAKVAQAVWKELEKASDDLRDEPDDDASDDLLELHSDLGLLDRPVTG